ncbi:FAD-dependent oxidoreductase [Anaerocolumna sedimenticola]|uniref:FAD-dependent oxidoreductase n=1 Tax=Anaerocolumna sedimenticola TaxID=2696063 RepID=A0A6P1TL70_9FIRM|nr:FAD-dependent oxidoreductase [Anaerocolumna sedimenticola]QHQ60872.1 FAD-dependent oxidoreductase [Anaerocolumna sedimenticola]
MDKNRNHNEYIVKKYDVVVVGGGMAGICAAIASARNGARTVLIQNRAVLGGNASSEIRMHICGADSHMNRPNARETGIIEEILLENRSRNPLHSFSILDTVNWEMVKYQENLELFLNTQTLEVITQNNVIKKIYAFQWTTEKSYEFQGNIYIDCTGDGNVAYQAGAECRMGREARSEFDEEFAPEQADKHTMGNTIMFCAKDTGKPSKFIKPFWAYDITEEQLKNRGHSHMVSAMENYGVDSGYWWLELGGTKDVIKDGEEIRDELLKYLYGIWDHIKNKGDHGAENYELEWVQFLPGKRESRRIMGDYILKYQDLKESRVFKDAVAYGGWPMDMHPPEGFMYSGEATNFIKLKDVYTIPYRCYYSKNIENLMMAGRNISATHMAFGSIRVMATCAVGGQAVGTAAALAVAKGCIPREIGADIEKLQQKLLKDDCYIPSVYNKDENDIARHSKVTASSWLKGYEPELVINGMSRTVKDENNCWKSMEISKTGEWLTLAFKPLEISEIILKFDSNLSQEIMISLSKVTRDMQRPGIPQTLVKDYSIHFYMDQKEVFSQKVKDNHQRVNKLTFTESIRADKITLCINSTHGCKDVTIYEVRIY